MLRIQRLIGPRSNDGGDCYDTVEWAKAPVFKERTAKKHKVYKSLNIKVCRVTSGDSEV